MENVTITQVVRDALSIWSHGASNKRGVSRALTRALDYEAKDGNGQYAKSLAQAAARVIHAQLGHLFLVGNGDYYPYDLPHRVEEDLALLRGFEDARSDPVDEAAEAHDTANTL